MLYHSPRHAAQEISGTKATALLKGDLNMEMGWYSDELNGNTRWDLLALTI